MTFTEESLGAVEDKVDLDMQNLPELKYSDKIEKEVLIVAPLGLENSEIAQQGKHFTKLHDSYYHTYEHIDFTDLYKPITQSSQFID